MLDNRKMVLYSYTPFGHIAVPGCRLGVEKSSQEEKRLDSQRLRIGGMNMRKTQPLRRGVVAITETVQVSGETALLQTESTEVSSIVDAHTITALPLAARNYIQLALLSPGATTVNPSSLSQPQLMTGAGRPDINGNREQAVAFLLDGIVNQEAKNNEVAYMPNVDAIQEFNIITQNPGAEFGNFAGGIISASIKSGTNSYHVDAFEFLRNDFLNSNTTTSSSATVTPQKKPTPRST